MIAATRQKTKQAILTRALDRGIKEPAPPVVASWVRDHLRLPDSDMRRMKRLYDKVMAETATEAESVELDSLMDACATMDLLRARVLFGATKSSAASAGK